MSEYKTDVNDVYSDDQINYGTETFPVFDVDHTVFAHSKNGTNHLPVDNTSNLGSYVQNRSTNRPFYIRYNGEVKKMK